jgi:hypothetical protein
MPAEERYAETILQPFLLEDRQKIGDAELIRVSIEKIKIWYVLQVITRSLIFQFFYVFAGRGLFNMTRCGEDSYAKMSAKN